jgi:2-hydroxy-3-oxopropionate reductase
MTVGFIGLGVMGLPMAGHLLDAGHDVLCTNRSSAAVGELVGLGARRAASVAELASRCDVIVTVLPDAPDVKQVLLGPAGAIAHAAPGTLLIDCSTIDPGTARDVAAQARSHRLRPVDAPVSGGEAGARAGTLAVMVGGRAEDVDAARPFLSAFGKTIVHVGDHGAGQTVKAVNQLLVAGNLALIAEAVVLLEASGIDLAPALSVLQGGLAGSRCLDLKGAAMVARDFQPGFRVDLHHKDIGIALATAGERRVALPVTAVVSQLLTSLRARGDGALDHGALLRIVEALAGRGPDVARTDEPAARTTSVAGPAA